MFYKNARIFTPDFRFHTGAFEVRDGLFGEILPENIPADAVDLNGATVIPGLTSHFVSQRNALGLGGDDVVIFRRTL